METLYSKKLKIYCCSAMAKYLNNSFVIFQRLFFFLNYFPLFYFPTWGRSLNKVCFCWNIRSKYEYVCFVGVKKSYLGIPSFSVSPLWLSRPSPLWLTQKNSTVCLFAIVTDMMIRHCDPSSFKFQFKLKLKFKIWKCWFSCHAARRRRVFPRQWRGRGGGVRASRQLFLQVRQPLWAKKVISHLPPFNPSLPSSLPPSIPTIPPAEHEYSLGNNFGCMLFTCEIYFFNQYFQYFNQLFFLGLS